ncbi:MAG: hypothetical protein M3Z01_05945 [Thermoproteota archaeon]|nr:hypothetical protein [Thermoproteota archaeon]
MKVFDRSINKKSKITVLHWLFSTITIITIVALTLGHTNYIANSSFDDINTIPEKEKVQNFVSIAKSINEKQQVLDTPSQLKVAPEF